MKIVISTMGLVFAALAVDVVPINGASLGNGLQFTGTKGVSGLSLAGVLLPNVPTP